MPVLNVAERRPQFPNIATIAFRAVIGGVSEPSHYLGTNFVPAESPFRPCFSGIDDQLTR